MKKSIEFKLLITITVLLLVISSCKKNTSNNPEKLLGTWISTDLVDTLNFKTEHDLYKGIYNEHFNYSISGDTITIQYQGVLFIYVRPTNHYYTINRDILTIDLEACYGFRNQRISFTRK